MNVLIWWEKNFERILMAASLALICIFMFIDISGRYLFSHSPTWTQELARFNMLNLCFLGISYGIRYNAHIKVDILPEIFPGLKGFFNVCSDAGMFIFGITLAVAGIGKLQALAKSGQIAVGTGIPMVFVYSLLEIGWCCCLLRIIQKYVLKIVYKKDFTYDAQDRKRIIDLDEGD